MGRPAYEITPEVLEETKTLAGQGLTKEQIARCLGMGYSTLMKKQAENVEFIEAIKKGQAEGISKVSNALFERAMGCNTVEERFQGDDVVSATKHYPPDPTSCIFYLKNRAPDEWHDRKEVVLEDKTTKLLQLTDDQLEHRRNENLGITSQTTH